MTFKEKQQLNLEKMNFGLILLLKAKVHTFSVSKDLHGNQPKQNLTNGNLLFSPPLMNRFKPWHDISNFEAVMFIFLYSAVSNMIYISKINQCVRGAP